MSNFNLTTIIDGSVGSAQGRNNITIETFVISLASGFVLFVVQFTIFLVIRIYPWSKRIYQPRSFLVPSRNRVKPPPNNPLKWIVSIFKIPSSVVMEKSGMDGYFFLRYLTMCLKIFLPMAIVILPILLPINAAGGKDNRTIDGVTYNVTGLDVLAWSNVSPAHTSRYWAHLLLAIASIGWVCYLVHHELLHYVQKRQEYLSSPGHRLRASATSVLITDIPAELCSVEKLTEHYDDFPGGLRRVWINRDFTPLVAMTDLRNKFENSLETAETNLLRKCTKVARKKGVREGDAKAMTTPTVHPLYERDGQVEDFSAAYTVAACESDLQYDVATRASWTKYVGAGHRAKTRIPSDTHPKLFRIPLLGRLFACRVDTIYYCRRELAKLNVRIESELQGRSESYPHIHSAFLQFNTQKAAHLACQGLSHGHPKKMQNRTIELAPGDINWPNLGLPYWKRYLRLIGFVVAFVILVFIFALISVVLGVISKVGTLESTTSWLLWINNLPVWLVSFVQGTVPPVVTIILLSGPLPIFLRMFTNDIRGSTTGAQGERSLQLWYFIFLLFELFIVPTISSGLTAVVRQLIHNPTSVPNILATNLPTAANYYFSFLIVEALSISASSILQTIRLLNYYVLGSTNTPDSVFSSLTWTNQTRIGSNIPWYTTYAVIGLTYAVIAPLMLVFMLITFSLFWFVIKNNVLYVVRTGKVDGGGLFFPSAINQTFTGLYFMEVCLIGLFFLVRDVQDNVTCQAQGIIMVVALIFTIFYQWWLFSTFHPLYTYLPVTTEGEAYQREKQDELEHLRAAKRVEDEESDEKTSEEFISDGTGHDSPAKSQALRAKGTGGTTAEQLAAPRASDLQAQQQRDQASSRRILERLTRSRGNTLQDSDEGAAEHHGHLDGGLISGLGGGALAHTLAPRQSDVERQMAEDPISRIIMRHNDDLEDLDPHERDQLVSAAFTHPVLRQARPSVWIPQDAIGVSDDEVLRTRALSKDLFIENRGAFFNRRLKVKVDMQPPDMSEFALLVDEL